MEERQPLYYIVAGPVVDAIEAYFVARDRHVAAMREIADELGCGQQLWFRGAEVCGFSVGPSRVVPAGMRRDRKEGGAIVPNKSTPVGKAIASRMFLAPKAPHRDDVMKAAGMKVGHYFDGGGLWEYSVGFGKIGDDWILTVRANDKGEPIPGAPLGGLLIPTSRYWAMKEAADAAEKAAS